MEENIKKHHCFLCNKYYKVDLACRIIKEKYHKNNESESNPKVTQKSSESNPKVTQKSSESNPKVTQKSSESNPKVTKKSSDSNSKVKLYNCSTREMEA